MFAFGVLLAELLAGEPAWAALKSHAQVIAAVLSGKRPSMPASAPSELKVVRADLLLYACMCSWCTCMTQAGSLSKHALPLQELALQCMAGNPKERPTFASILDTLQRLSQLPPWAEPGA